MTDTFHANWKKGYIEHYNRFEKERCRKSLHCLYPFQMLNIIMANDDELLNDALQNKITMGRFFRLDACFDDRNETESIDYLIDIAIRYESHDCYLLLVEYKRSHNLYQDNPFEL